MEEENNVVLL